MQKKRSGIYFKTGKCVITFFAAVGFVMTAIFVASFGNSDGVARVWLYDERRDADLRRCCGNRKAWVMDAKDKLFSKNSTHIILDPPAFAPPAEMRKKYLDRRLLESDVMLDQANAGEWKAVMVIINHVRGTGAMYGFPNIGDAAETLSRAVQNGEADCLPYLEKYVATVRESYV